MYRQEPGSIQSLLAGEDQLLELIVEGAPLPQILDRVCTALDLQLGNVVSLVLLWDDEEHTHHTIAHSAEKFGLSAFSCIAILSPGAEFLGTLETYSCFPREPSLAESELVDRAAHLAALVIQHNNHELEIDDWSLDWAAAMDRFPREGPPSSN